MAYTKKTWECGETITADALNRMEDGIEEAIQSGGGTPLILEVVSEREATVEECDDGGTVYTYNHTWQEVYDAVMQGVPVIVVFDDEALLSVIVIMDVEHDKMGGEYFVGTNIKANTPTEPLHMIVCGGK